MMNKVKGYRYYRYNDYDGLGETLLVEFRDDGSGKIVMWFEGMHPFSPSVKEHVKGLIKGGKWILKGELREEDLELLPRELLN